MTYSEKLRDPRWQKKRLEVFRDAGFRCEECGAENKTLNAHHCYYTGADPWVQGSADAHMFKALCDECHEERQSLEHDVKLEFARLLAEMPIGKLREMMDEILDRRASNGTALI